MTLEPREPNKITATAVPVPERERIAYGAGYGVRGHRTPSPYAITQPARLAGAAQPERSSSAGVAANLFVA